MAAGLSSSPLAVFSKPTAFPGSLAGTAMFAHFDKFAGAASLLAATGATLRIFDARPKIEDHCRGADYFGASLSEAHGSAAKENVI